LRSSPEESERRVFLERKAMAKGRKVLTTGEVAEICNVASRTVGKWFDGGLLKGYRIPGSRDRRIPIAELAGFMKEYGIPGHEELRGG
jgi:excisionase family DNA binding protein